MVDKVATYGLNLESNTAEVSKESAAALEQLRAKIAQSTEFVKQMQGSLKSLRGASDEVKGAKESLTAKIEAERGAISSANLAILKQGQTYEKLALAEKKSLSAKKEMAAADKAATAAANKEAEAAKKEAEAAAKAANAKKEMTAAEKAAAAPVKGLTEKFEKLGAQLTTSTGVMGLAVLGTVALGAGLVELASKAAGAAFDVAQFTVVSADLARSRGLTLEAANGGAANAKAWGEQIDALARKVPTSTEKLNELAVSLSKTLSGGQSKAGGQTIIDTFNAVGEASSAAGDEAGSAIQTIIEEGKRFGRIGLDPSTLQGKWNTGWEDISKAVAKNLGVSLKDAKVALLQHRVTIDAGARAIRDAVETRFGEINAKKLISLDSISQKLHDDWINLTKGFNLEPILAGMKKVADLFDITSVEGYALKELFTGLGQDLGANVDDGVSIAKIAVDEFIIALQELELWVLENKKDWQKAFDDAGGMDAVKGDVIAIKDAVVDLAKALKETVELMLTLKHAAATTIDRAKTSGVGGAQTQKEDKENLQAQSGGIKKILSGGASGADIWGWLIGKDITKGVADGVKAGAPDLDKAMADTVKGGLDAAKGPEGADAHSPSKKAAKIGADISAGTAAGVAANDDGVADAMTNMVQMPRPARASASASAAGGDGGGTHVEVHIHVDGGKGGEATAKALSAPSFLAELTKAIRQALVTQGVPTQAPRSAA